MTEEMFGVVIQKITVSWKTLKNGFVFPGRQKKVV